MPRLIVAAGLAFGLLAACSGGSRVGSMADFCAGSHELTTNLQHLATATEIDLDDLDHIRTEIRALKAPKAVRADLDALAQLLGDVVDGYRQQGEGTGTITDFRQRLGALEAQATDARDASTRVAAAVARCASGSGE